MAKVVNVGYTDTAISGVSSLTIARGLLNFKENFRVKSQQPGEVVLTNISSPVDRPETVRVGVSNIANVYSGTAIESSLAAPTKRGVSILAQVSEVISVTDSTDANYRIDLPVSCHLVIKVPANENLTSTMVQTMIGRLISCLYETGSTDTTRLEALMRGSLIPSDL